MNAHDLAWNLVLAVHILAAAIWVGGMFYAQAVLRPALAVLEPAPRTQLYMQALKRFFLVVWHAMPLQLVTGWAMVLGLWGGFAALPWQVNAMQALGVLMALVFAYLFFGPWQRVRRAIRPGAELFARVRRLLTLNLVLGVATIVLGALGNRW